MGSLFAHILQSWPKGSGTLLLPPPLFGRKWMSDRQLTITHFWPVTPNTVQGGGGCLENAQIMCK